MAAGTPVWFVAAVAGLATTMALAIDVLWATRVMEAAIVPIACAVAFHAVALGGWWEVTTRLRRSDKWGHPPR